MAWYHRKLLHPCGINGYRSVWKEEMKSLNTRQWEPVPLTRIFNDAAENIGVIIDELNSNKIVHKMCPVGSFIVNPLDNRLVTVQKSIISILYLNSNRNQVPWLLPGNILIYVTLLAKGPALMTWYSFVVNLQHKKKISVKWNQTYVIGSEVWSLIKCNNTIFWHIAIIFLIILSAWSIRN